MAVSFKGAYFPQDIILPEQCQQQSQAMLGGRNRGRGRRRMTLGSAPGPDAGCFARPSGP
jgi:hypothetical protein